MSESNLHRERKIDAAVEMTFPASDPTATGAATGTEAPRRPMERRAPLIRKEDIERAQRGAQHTMVSVSRTDEGSAKLTNREGPSTWLTFLAFGALLLILGSAATFLVEGWERAGAQMSIHGWIALVLGIVFSLLVGCGLMALMFYSSRRGYDEQPEREHRP